MPKASAGMILGLSTGELRIYNEQDMIDQLSLGGKLAFARVVESTRMSTTLALLSCNQARSYRRHSVLDTFGATLTYLVG